ncbi:MAG: hypothetical protein Q9164_001281 [Protoblastenia rupestris]
MTERKKFADATRVETGDEDVNALYLFENFVPALSPRLRSDSHMYAITREMWDVYTLLRQARIDLDTIRRERGDRTTDDIDDHIYRYVNPSLGDGMQWIISQDPQRSPSKNLTYQMVEIVRFGTGRLVEEYGTQRVKSTFFFLWLHDKGGQHYIAEGGLDSDVEGNVMSSQSKAQR